MKIGLKKTAWIAVAAVLTSPAYALKPADEAIIELYQRVEDLQHDVNSLRGTNEQLRHELSSIKKSQKESFIDVDDRIQVLADEIKRSQGTSSGDDSVKTEPSESSSSSSSESTPKDDDQADDSSTSRKVKDTVAYKRAYDLMKDNPTAAAADFKDFLNDYPSSPLAANAHYWIGETHYAKEEFAEAKKSFLTVLKDYKGSNKEPDAALKLGYTFIALKEWDFAKKTLKDVIRFFPGTKEANLAEKKLASIENK